MSGMNNGGWPFAEDTSDEGLDYSAIFGGGAAASDVNPFDVPAAQVEETVVLPKQTQTEVPAEQPVQTDTEPKKAPLASISEPEVQEETPPAETQEAKTDDPPAEVPNPIEAAFAQKTTENTRQGLLEKLPIFCHKNVKEPIEDTSQTFEDLRIRKSEDFADLEEGKYVSWSVDYCGIRKEIKDPKGSTIASVKETIEQSWEFLQALKKFKGKTPECLVKPKVVMKTKGTAGYKGKFQTVEEARASDKVICLIPSSDGRFYELRKTEQGEFIAPKNKVVDFQQVRAGFIPALPLIPLSLISTITAFFRAFMQENEEYEVLALIYWDKVERRFFSYVPKQVVSREHIDADLRNCPYDDGTRYIRYADIHSHNSMEAFFSSVDDMDERGTGLYLVMGELNRFFPENKARVLAERYSMVFGLEAEYVPSFIENLDALMELIRPNGWELEANSFRQTTEMVILLGAVDNNKTRQLCHQAFYQSKDLVYIDSGNGEFSGQVVCGVRKNSRTVFKPIGGVHPALLKSTDKFPTELSCAEAADSDPQSIAANITAATAVVDMVYNILAHGESAVRQTDFSTRTVKMQTILEKQRRKAA